MTRRARLTARLMTISKPSLSFLFAGVSKNTQQEHKVRGDINVLLCGDPGKVSVLEVCPEDCSQGCFLHRTGSFCCWSDSYVQRSQLTNEWTLEALVLADEGVCLIWQDEHPQAEEALGIFPTHPLVCLSTNGTWKEQGGGDVWAVVTPLSRGHLYLVFQVCSLWSLLKFAVKHL